MEFRIAASGWQSYPVVQVYRGVWVDYGPSPYNLGYNDIPFDILVNPQFEKAANEFPAAHSAEQFKAQLLQAISAAKRHKMFADAPKILVRFGRPPRSGRSRNHRDGTLEPGVSCYLAAEVGEEIWISLRHIDSASAAFIATRELYIIEGDIVGTGSDGEPCVRVFRFRKSRLPWKFI